MKIKIIGKGFIGSHLIDALKNHEIVEDNPDIIFYCAGVMRSENPSDFYKVNYEMLKECVKNINVPVVYLSSTQYDLDNDYGRSKRLGESVMQEYEHGIIYRLNNTFGDGAKPNYNSVVSTWLYNIKHDIPIIINNPDTKLKICYIEDVIKCLLKAISGESEKVNYIEPVYEVTLGELANIIYGFKNNEPSNELGIKLYETYKKY